MRTGSLTKDDLMKEGTVELLGADFQSMMELLKKGLSARDWKAWRGRKSAAASVGQGGALWDGEEETLLQSLEEDVEDESRCGLRRRPQRGKVGNGAHLWRRGQV